MKRLLGTLLFSLRLSLKSPMNTILCIAVLACGIALATTTYKLYDMVFASTVPYENSENMVMIQRRAKNGNLDNTWPMLSLRMFLERQDIFEDIILYVPEGASLKHGEQGALANVMYTKPNFTKLAQVYPFMGRSITEEDCNSANGSVAVIAYDIWRDMYGSDPDVVGKTILSDGIVRTIVGVMPEHFDGPFPMTRVQIWLPLNLDTIKDDTGWVTFSSMIGIAKKDISRKKAESRAAEIMADIIKTYPQENDGIATVGLRYYNDKFTDDNSAKILSAVFICGFLVLFMSCGIVSGLLTARYSTRSQEIAVRSALGASRLQIVGQMIVEFLAISIPSVILGFLLSHWFDVAVMQSFLDRFQIPDFMLHRDSTRMTVFVVAILCFVSLVSTVMPALRASKTDLSSVLHESTRTGSSLRVTKMSNFLITWQVATACVVMAGGAIVGYFIYDYRNFNNLINPDDYFVARIAFNAKDHSYKARVNLTDEIVRRIRQNPGVVNACLSNEFFYGNQAAGGERHIWLDGDDYATEFDAPIAVNRIVSPGYMETMNIPILQGRDFTSSDDSSHPVVIVTQGFAMERFGTLDVLGRRFRMGRNDVWLTIVGLVPEVYNPKNDPTSHNGFFRPFALEPWDDIFIFVRGRLPFEQMHRLVTDAVERTDTKICISRFFTYNDARAFNGPETFMSFILALFVTFSICTLLMTAGGLYGIISFSTNMRRTEMGIRLALGAKPMGLVLLMTRKGLLFVAIGLALGAFGSFFLRSALIGTFGTSSEAPWTYAACALVLLSIAGISIFLPAFSAARCDPARALKDE